MPTISGNLFWRKALPGGQREDLPVALREGRDRRLQSPAGQVVLGRRFDLGGVAHFARKAGPARRWSDGGRRAGA
jgi:hypothetical protein